MIQDERRLLWYLKKIPFFEGLPSEAFSDFIDNIEQVELRRRRLVYIPGDPGDKIYFINGGRVKVSRVTRDGREITIAYRLPGEMFGELCLIDGGPRQEMAEITENALITSMERKYFEKLLKRYPALVRDLMHLSLLRRLELEEKLGNIVFRDVHSKLAELLHNLGKEYGVEDSRGTKVGIKITHQEMANLIGATRETVSLTLSQFKKKGLIMLEGRRLIILDFDGLKAMI